MTTDTDDEYDQRCVCFDCVGEAYLSHEIQTKGKVRTCSYCDVKQATYLIGELAGEIETAFEHHYYRTSDQPSDWEYSLLADKESDFNFERHGEPVLWAIAGAADIAEEVAKDVLEILSDNHSDLEMAQMGEETEFDDDSHYEEKGIDDREWQEGWRTFEQSLKTEARFFNAEATRYLDEVFKDFDKHKTENGKPLVVAAGPDTDYARIYRARVFQSDERLEAGLSNVEVELASPPPRLAMGGRMNAPGISTFYGANDPNAALAEVRPPVGSQVAVARFDIVRPLRLLDLTALDTVSHGTGSIFDPAWSALLGHVKFLRSLSARLTRPVMPDDESLEYLATQAIADYLASSRELKLDGIIFPSVQVAGGALNIVLFQKASRVERRKLPLGTEITASTGYSDDEGWNDDYSIYEKVPAQKKQLNPPFDSLETIGDPELPSWHQSADPRPVTLRIDFKGINVHTVEAVSFTAPAHPVRHYQWERQHEAPKPAPIELVDLL